MLQPLLGPHDGHQPLLTILDLSKIITLPALVKVTQLVPATCSDTSEHVQPAGLFHIGRSASHCIIKSLLVH